jgi:type IV pilus assembly protein PilB
MPQTLKERLADFLVKNVITKEQLDKALSVQKSKGGSLSKIIIEQGFATEKQIMAGLGEYMGLPPIDLGKIKIPSEIIELIPKTVALFYQAVPISKVGKFLTVAMADPLNVLAIDDLKVVTGYDIQPVISNFKDIQQTIESYYASPSTDMQDIISEVPISEVEIEAEQEMNLSELIAQTDKAPVIRIVNLILYQGIKNKASDIHIEPYEHQLRLRYRIDGVLFENPPPPKHMHAAIVSRIKILAKLDIAERRTPQDGRFRIRMEGKDVDFRVSILPTSFGEKVVMRILDKSSLSMDLSKLGFSGRSGEIFKNSIQAPYGMILITGPTGSGKTTTLYSALSTINEPGVNIITIEDPVEYQFAGINQIAVRSEIGLTFASGLRSILRQDPDVIMVGEIRDLETAEIAIQSALTGHLVFSTLHTNDAAGSITRLVDMGIEPFLLSSSLLMIVAQRLVRKICPTCKKPVEIPLPVLERIGYKCDKDKLPVFYKGAGCKKCKGIGYAGRLGLYEVLEVTKDIRDLMTQKVTADDIKRQAVKDGMQNLREYGIERAKEGLTTLEEVLRVTARG